MFADPRHDTVVSSTRTATDLMLALLVTVTVPSHTLLPSDIRRSTRVPLELNCLFFPTPPVCRPTWAPPVHGPPGVRTPSLRSVALMICRAVPAVCASNALL